MTPEQWKRNAGRWRLLLGAAFFLAFLVIVVAALEPDAGAGMAGFGFLGVVLAFLAGQWKAEHARLSGDDRIAGQRRPEGVRS